MHRLVIQMAAALSVICSVCWPRVAPVAAAAGPDGETLADLPITALPSAADGQLMAIILSGDGGWRDLDRDIGEWLAAHGVPTVGLDSLHYFWLAKSPATIAADLGRIAQRYERLWRRSRLMLIGYSFGAGVLPASLPLLDPALQQQLVLVALLGVETRADFEIRVAGWVGGTSADARPVLPDALKLKPQLVLCVYGQEETDTLCRAPEMARFERLETPGGHHFDGDYDTLAARLLDAAKRRLDPGG